MSVRDTVFSLVHNVADQQRKKIPPHLTDDMGILESGMDSLCFAVLVASLDDEFNVSPFDGDHTGIPMTYGDLVRIYDAALAH